jgi:hypothetical protein
VEAIFAQSQATIVPLHAGFRTFANNSSRTLPCMPQEEKRGHSKSIVSQSREAVTLRSFQDAQAGLGAFFWSAMDWFFGIDTSADAAAHEDGEKRAVNRVEALPVLDGTRVSELGRAGAVRPYTSFPPAIRDRRSSARQPLLRASPPPDEDDNYGLETLPHEDSVKSRKLLPPGARYARPRDAPRELNRKSDDDPSPPHSLNSRPPYHPHDGVPAPGSRIIESFLTIPSSQPFPQLDNYVDDRHRNGASCVVPCLAPASPVIRPSTSSSRTDGAYLTAEERPSTSETLVPPEHGVSRKRSSGSSSTDSPTLGELYLNNGNSHHHPMQPRPLPTTPAPQYLPYYADPLQKAGFPPSFPLALGQQLSPSTPLQQQQPHHHISNPPQLAHPPRSLSSGTYATRGTIQSPSQQHWGNPSSSTPDVLTFVRMSDGKLVRKLSTIASESEPATSVTGGGGGGGGGGSSVRSNSLSSTSALAPKYVGSASPRSQL